MQKLERSLPSIALNFVGSIALYCLTPLTPATGQITPDSTQGAENSVVTPNANVRGLPASLIEGGATRGENLFHSFSDFNVGEGLRVYFANPVGIENILTRVTGSNVSNILGTLGVNGTANLFLLNPNGISFGPNARLDIGGSFFASTASSFKFSDGSEFSATNPQAPPLLTVKVTPGLQWGASKPGATITNRGNLAPQQDLTLVADTLDLQGQLLSGRDLTLFATDTVKVRDSAASPFIASAGSQLLVQGNRVVDIFALNHPESGLFSGGNMVLRSGNTVEGDAHYWSGGSFRIETLDGNLGSLYSPNGPIILADGDVSFDSYEGASLHIFAGGSVTITGDVTIIEPDTLFNLIQENVTLSDGKTVVQIDGNTQQTLDIRAGTRAFEPFFSIDDGTGFSPNFPNINTTATSADITVAGKITNPAGVVFLTNQYKPNLALPGGAIRVGAIDTSNYDGGNNGAVTIDSRGKIELMGDINSFSRFLDREDREGITLVAGGDISTKNLFSNSHWNTDGGAIVLMASGNISTGSLDSSTWNANGGAIVLMASGNIFTESLDSSSGNGNGGAIVLMTSGNISTGKLNSSSLENAGAIALTASGNISTESLDSRSQYGNGGAIALTANGNITITQLDSSTKGGNGGAIAITSDTGAFSINNGLIRSNAYNNGNGGDIHINATSVSLSNTDVITTAGGVGNAGQISIRADDLVLLDKSRLFTSLELGARGNGGDITIEAGTVSLTRASFIDTATFGQGNAGNVKLEANNSVSLNKDSAIFSITAGQGNGGNVTVKAGGVVSLTNRSNISTAVDSGAVGDGGNIEIEARSLSLLDGSQLVTSTLSSGRAGNIDVNAIEGVNISSVESVPPQLRNVPITPPRTVDEIEQNDSIDQAQILDSSFSLDNPNDATSSIEFSTKIPYVSVSSDLSNAAPDYDYYSFKVTEGTRAIVKIVKRTIPGDGYSPVHLSLTLFDSNGNELISDSGYTRFITVFGNGDPRIGLYLSDILDISFRYVFNEPGTYFIGVKPIRNDSGPYALNISLGTPNAATTVDKGILASGLFARTEGAGMAGTVTINTPQLTVQNGGNISATATAAATGSAQGGSVQVNASQINLSGNTSGLFALTEGAAPAGSLTLQPYNNEQTLRVNFQDGAQISASTSGAGKGGSLSVTAPESVTLSGNGELSVETSGAGQAGDVTLATETLNIENGAKVSATSSATATSSAQGGQISANTSQINLSGTGGGLFAETQGIAPAGSLTLQPYNNEQSLRINFQDDTKISASTSSNGQGGSLIVTAPESVILSGNGQLSAETNSTGEAGSATINTRHLTVQDRAQVSASTSGTGQGGNLQVNASDSVLLNNQGSLVTESSGSGAAGDLTINTRELTLDNSAKVSTSTLSSQGGDITLQGLNTLAVTNSLISASTETGTAGSLSVTATESVDLRGTGGLSVEATEGGTAGDLTVKTGQMSVREGAKVTVSSPSGQAGNLNISANSLSLNRGTLSAETGTSSNEGGANINLSGLDFLLMGNESLISANARGDANGGNITINSTFIIATPPTGSQGSDIVANAVFGNGGQVSLTTQGLFGIEFRPLRTPKNDITVTSEFGLTGVFQRNSPDVDPSRGLTNLPAEFVDASNQITQNCPARGSRSENSFTITGTGGLPPRPGDAFDSPFPTGTVRSLPGSSTSSNESPSAVAVTNPVELNSPTLNRSNSTNSHTSLVEAAGWIYGPNGEVILTAVTPNFTPHGSWSKPSTCD